MSDFVVVVKPVGKQRVMHEQVIALRINNAMDRLYKHRYDIEQKGDSLYITLKETEE